MSQHPKGHRSPPGILLENLVTFTNTKYNSRPTAGAWAGTDGADGSGGRRSERMFGAEAGRSREEISAEKGIEKIWEAVR